MKSRKLFPRVTVVEVAAAVVAVTEEIADMDDMEKAVVDDMEKAVDDMARVVDDMAAAVVVVVVAMEDTTGTVEVRFETS